jgi:hypothetical protein
MTSKWSDPAVGARTATVFTDALARLVGHEVDHLYGNLYTARMRDGRLHEDHRHTTVPPGPQQPSGDSRKPQMHVSEHRAVMCPAFSGQLLDG